MQVYRNPVLRGEVAGDLSAGLEAGRLPDMASLRERFSSDPAALPVVTVRLAMKW